jgi:hypothetical protein
MMVSVDRSAMRILVVACVTLLGVGMAVPSWAGGQTRDQSVRAVPVAGQRSSTTSAAAVVAPRAAGSYVALTPLRLLDTRISLGASGPVAAGRSIALSVLGRGGVPASGVAAVALTVTVTEPAVAGYVTVYPSGAARPSTSSIVFSAGQTMAKTVIVPVGANGRVQLFFGAASGSVQIIADGAGFYVSGSPTAAGTFQALPAHRILDTRVGIGGPRASLQALATRALTVVGANGVPRTGVRAVVLDVTVTGPTANGYLTVYPNGQPRPNTSSVNFVPGQTVANLVIVPVSTSGQIMLFNGSVGPIDVVADVVGYHLGGNPGVPGSLLTLPQARLLDTVHGIGAPARAVGALGTLSLQVAGVLGAPGSGMIAVALNVTSVTPRAPGYLTVYPSGSPRPAVSHLDFAAKQTVSNLVVVPIRSDGRIQLFNASGGSTDLIVDLVGVYLDGPGAGRCTGVRLDTTGTLVTRWNPLVTCILSVLGQSQSAAGISDVDTIIQYESSGDPHAINNYDINAQEGHPSEGLIQVIRPTFDAFRSFQLPDDLFDPAANLYAGLHYAIHTYGSIHNVPGLVSLRGGGGYQGYVVSR